jgi:hypothetical protein
MKPTLCTNTIRYDNQVQPLSQTPPYADAFNSALPIVSSIVFNAQNDVLEICGDADRGDDSVAGSRVIIYLYYGRGAASFEMKRIRL